MPEVYVLKADKRAALDDFVALALHVPRDVSLQSPNPTGGSRCEAPSSPYGWLLLLLKASISYKLEYWIMELC